jgi:hypothetical protein
MRSTSLLAAAVGVASLLAAAVAPARGAVPFFAPSGNAFDPEIGIVESGVLLDATAVVSADRKYVTMTLRPQNSQLIALREFAFQNPQNLGFVGAPQQNMQQNVQQNVQGNANNGAAGGATGRAGGRNNVAANRAAAQPVQRPVVAAPPARPSVLDRPGMTRVDARGN